MQYEFKPFQPIIKSIFFVLIAVGLMLTIVRNVGLIYIIILVGTLFIWDLVSLRTLSPYLFCLGILVACIGVWFLIDGDEYRGQIFLAIAGIILATATFFSKVKQAVK